MAAPTTHYKGDGKARIGITDANKEIDATSDVVVSSTKWDAEQTNFLRFARRGVILGLTSTYTGSPVCTLVAQYTIDGTNWHEFGRASAPSTAGTFQIPLLFPIPPDALQVRIAVDATGATLDASNKFTVVAANTHINLDW